MKELDNPKTGKRANTVAFRTRYGQCSRDYVQPKNPRTDAQRLWRADMGDVSAAWATIAEEQRLAWVASGLQVRKRDSLGRRYSLTGQAHFVGINSARVRIGREMLLDPPQPVLFGLNPVEKLIIKVVGGRLKLYLSVCEPLTADIMVFGAVPCSPGRMKCRKVTYLGLLPAPVRGLCDITKLYRDMFGLPPIGSCVFIRVRQQLNGWESSDADFSAIVLPKPALAPSRRRP
jgi:hypothetical protein